MMNLKCFLGGHEGGGGHCVGNEGVLFMCVDIDRESSEATLLTPTYCSKILLVHLFVEGRNYLEITNRKSCSRANDRSTTAVRM